MKVIKNYVIPMIFTFGITVVLCISLLYITGMIPQKAIAENVEKSAEYFYEEELFPYLIQGRFHTRQDNYADCILVNIMYHIDGDHLLSSLMEASYYNPDQENVNVSLWNALNEPKKANVVYDRYWHGSMVLLRPLFVWTDIVGVRMVLGVVLLLLTLLVSVFLYQREEKALAFCYVIAPLCIQVWMSVFCIEYITTFLVMNVAVLGVIFLYDRYKTEEILLYQRLLLLMCAVGIITCFADFLTTETLTVTVPLFVLLVFRYRNHQLKDMKREVLTMAGAGAVWGVSYGGMFFTKWLLSSLLLGKNAFQSALASVEERTVGVVTLGSSSLDPKAGLGQKLLGALLRNQGVMFPFRDEMKMGSAFVAYFGILFLAFAIIYMLRSKNLSFKMILLSCMLSAVPYVRYLVLSNHSYLHYFFTYRAQLILCLALLFCCWEFGISNIVGTKKPKQKRK